MSNKDNKEKKVENGQDNIIDSLPPVKTHQEVAMRIEAYPNYPFNKIVSDEDFARLFDNMNLIDAFQADFPKHINVIVERLLTSNTVFARVFRHVNSFIRFKTAFPGGLSDRAVKRLLDNGALVAARLNNIDVLTIFATEFPEHAGRVANYVLTNDVLFERVFFSSPGAYPGLYLGEFKSHFPAYGDRAEALFKAKQQARQEEAKSVGLTAGGSIHQTTSSSSSTTTSSYGPSGPSMFSSSSSVPTGSQQDQLPMEEANAAGLPAGDNGEAVIQTSSDSLNVDLPNGDGSEDEEPGSNPSPSNGDDSEDEEPGGNPPPPLSG
jgi:hypothetical protein